MLAKLPVVLLLLLSCRLYAIDGVIVVTTDQAFQDKWHYTAGDVAPEFSRAETVFVSQKFSILLFLSDFGTTQEGHAHVTYDLDLRNPSYERIFEESGITAIQGVVPNPHQVLLSEANLKASLDSHELTGRYWINVRVYDWVDSVYRDLESTFELQQLEYEPVFSSDERFLQWRDQYYRNPRPALALDGFLYFVRSELRLNEAEYWPMFNFFLEIYKANPFLLPSLAALYPGQPSSARVHILYLLRFAGYRDPRFLASLQGEEKETFEKLLFQELIPPAQPVSSPQELEVLWTSFLATGSFASIENLVENLTFGRYKGSGRNYRSAAEPAKDLQATLYEGIYQHALLTLVTNIESHPLVKSYCNYLYHHGDLSEAARAELKEVLGE